MDLFKPLKALWDGLNPATLSGAIDVLAVEQPDGSLLSTCFHVRFGKLTLLRPQERVVCQLLIIVIIRLAEFLFLCDNVPLLMV